MGKQARERAERRAARHIAGQPLQLLRELFSKIQRRSSESSRRSWEMMLEVMAHSSGMDAGTASCLSQQAATLLPDLGDVDSLLLEFITAWERELRHCADGRAPITDPVGTILEEIGGTNRELGQFLTLPSVIRLINAVMYLPDDGSKECLRVLDPFCGTGRFALDALVHVPRAIIINADIDLWMVRAALINFRFAPHFSGARVMVTDESGGTRLEVVPSGRAFVLRADSLLVDLTHPDNWRYAQQWSPPPWQATLKLTNFDGTFEEFRQRRSSREIERHKADARAKAARSERLVNLQLDEAKLHAEMLRMASGIAVPTTTERRSSLVGNDAPDVSSTLPSATPTSPLLPGRRR